MIFKREDYSQQCHNCLGEGRVYIDSSGITIVKKCHVCNGSGEVLTEEGEAIFKLLLCGTNK